MLDKPNNGISLKTNEHHSGLSDHGYPSLKFRAYSDMNEVLDWSYFRSRAIVDSFDFEWRDPHSILLVEWLNKLPDD